MKTPVRYYAALAVLCSIALCIGFASAAGTTQAMHTGTPGMDTIYPAQDLTNAMVLQGIPVPCKNPDADTAALTVALRHDDTDSVMSWVRMFFTVRP
jgi:hypothetical protein